MNGLLTIDCNRPVDVVEVSNALCPCPMFCCFKFENTPTDRRKGGCFTCLSRGPNNSGSERIDRMCVPSVKLWCVGLWNVTPKHFALGFNIYIVKLVLLPRKLQSLSNAISWCKDSQIVDVSSSGHPRK